jgi:hypothetical protein
MRESESHDVEGMLGSSSVWSPLRWSRLLWELWHVTCNRSTLVAEQLPGTADGSTGRVDLMLWQMRAMCGAEVRRLLSEDKLDDWRP